MTPTRFSLKNIAERRATVRSIVEPLVAAKRDSTQMKIYERVAPGVDGRSHTVLSAIGTSTFRMSSSESPLFEHSTNWQNMPKKTSKLDPLYRIRDVVIPDEGYELVAGDYKGAEAVLVAAYSQDWPFLDKLLSGADIHTEHGQHFFTTDIVTSFQRDLAKTITYASFYIASPFTITERINKESDVTGVRVTVDEVARLRSILLQLHPLEAWWERTRQELLDHEGVLRNCFGYRRVFRDPDENHRLKAALSNYPQSTVAWLVNAVVAEAYLRYPEIARNLLLQIHDELLFQSRPDETYDLLRTLTPLYERPFRVHNHELYVPVEWKHGPDWGSMKELKL